MNVRLLACLLCSAALGVAVAQDVPGSQGSGAQGPGQQGSGQQGSGQGGWQRSGRGGGGMMGMGRGTVGTVTEAAADHYTIKTELGEVYTIHFSVNTRIMKQPPGTGQRGNRGAGARQDAGAEDGGMRTPPQPIKPADIKIGDVIAASGDVDATAKSVGAIFVMLIDPERAKEMRAMEANYGKTWLAGRVTAINETKVNLEGGPDRAVHSFVADENTTFRKRRDPVTLGDMQVGDMVRVEGAVKDSVFVATTVVVMGPPPQGAGNQEPGGPPPQQ